MKESEQDFRCTNCGIVVTKSEEMGTKHRNHCPFCLYSKHVDDNTPGDRKSPCKSKMKPVGLTIKHEGIDKYGKEKIGELMLIHLCCNPECNKISINRLAGDDDPEKVYDVYLGSLSSIDKLKKRLQTEKIKLLTSREKEIVLLQLFGSDSEE
jgi:hypothetical protein